MSDISTTTSKNRTEPEKTSDALPQLQTVIPENTPLKDLAESEKAPEAWSVFPRDKKALIITLSAASGFFSPVSGAIYYPAIQTLTKELDKSTSLINLTITSYMIFQGLAPTFFGSLAEGLGKRPVYLITFTIYIAANIGLALQDSYAALIVLRCLQSTGSSATVALAVGTAGDIAKGSERGKYVGYTSLGIMVGPAIGPVIGGLLAGFLSWRAIFWFLAITAGVFIIVYAIFCPETARSVVGNGSIPPPTLNKSLIDIMVSRKHDAAANDLEKVQITNSSSPSKRTITFPNPIQVLSVMRDPDIAIILLISAFLFAACYDLSASLVTIFKATYHFNDIQIGLCYMPFGVGTVIASLLGGRLADWNFRRIARNENLSIDKPSLSPESQSFPWERARLQVAAPPLIFTTACLLCYGWVLQEKTNLAVPLILQFFIGLGSTIVINVLSVMLVDAYPSKSALVSAANNFTRCLLGAGATACIEPMLQAMGRGPCFTFIGGVLAVSCPLVWLLGKKGPEWRKGRLLRGREGC